MVLKNAGLSLFLSYIINTVIIMLIVFSFLSFFFLARKHFMCQQSNEQDKNN